jgi:hypothetical protein
LAGCVETGADLMEGTSGCVKPAASDDFMSDDYMSDDYMGDGYMSDGYE